MITRVFCLVCSIVFLSGCTKERDASYLEKIKSRGYIKVGTTGDYKPFTYRDSTSGQYVGIDIDLMNLLAKSLGVKLQIIETTWPTLIEDFKSKKYDIAISGITQTKKREEFALFSAPYHQGGKVAFGRCKDASKFATPESLDKPNIKYIVNPGGTNESFTRGFVKKAQVILHKDNKSVFDEILEGRADIMISDSIEVDVLTAQYKGVLCRFSEKPFSKSLHNIAVLLPQNSKLKEVINSWIGKLKESGELNRIFKKNIDLFGQKKLTGQSEKEGVKMSDNLLDETSELFEFKDVVRVELKFVPNSSSKSPDSASIVDPAEISKLRDLITKLVKVCEIGVDYDDFPDELHIDGFKSDGSKTRITIHNDETIVIGGDSCYYRSLILSDRLKELIALSKKLLKKN